MLLAASASAWANTIAGNNPCGVKSPEEAQREAIYCGADAACIARETAALPEAERALKCEAQRLSPANMLNGAGATLPATNSGQIQ
jgi:hypothetical protein